MLNKEQIYRRMDAVCQEYSINEAKARRIMAQKIKFYERKLDNLARNSDGRKDE